MSYKTLFLSLGVTVLFVQLATIEPSVRIHISNFSYGEFTYLKSVNTLTSSFTRVFQETFYSSVERKGYESIVFVGDVMLARNVEYIMDREGQEYPFQAIDLQTLSANAAIVGNFESSMSLNHQVTPANQLTFSVNPLFLTGILSAGFTHMSLANNHSYDYGEEGFRNTKQRISELNIASFGSENSATENSISYIETAQGKVALVGINASDGKLKNEDALKIMRLAEAKSDIQIAYIHWGIEYDTVHHSVQTKFAKNLIDSGADLIVGHHPHVVQDVDIIDGVVVFYSLGNYVFDQYFSQEVQEGAILVLEFGEVPVVHILPVSSQEKLSQPAFMTEKKHLSFLRSLADRSNPALSDFIITGTIPLRAAVATSSKMAMMIQ